MNGSSSKNERLTSSGFSRDPSGHACLGGRPLAEVLEEAEVKTPVYIYDLGAMRSRLILLKQACAGRPHLVAFAMKANNAGAVLRTFRDAGAGIDAVSGGELRLALAAGFAAQSIVFSGVAKTTDELDLALQHEIYSLQAESPSEVVRILARAETLGRKARVSLRINPEVQIDSHAHISTGHSKAKFGIPVAEIGALAELLGTSPHGRLVGLSTHVGSMLRSTSGYLDSARVVCEQAHILQALDHHLEFVDFGGGFGIDYGQAPAPEPAEFASAALDLLKSEKLESHTLVVEPGRSLVGPFGVLVASVIQTKQSGDLSWVMIDAGMNDLMRPALYGAIHRIEPLERAPGSAVHQVAGPVCESTDDFGSHALGEVPSSVVIRDAGAYGYTMANQYNGRALPTEVFLDQGKVVHVSPTLGVDPWVAQRLR